MSGVIEILRAVERAPLRTVRFTDVQHLASNVWRVLDDLVERGALLRLAQGVYTAPPDGRDGRLWTPGLEAAGLAIATARHGNRRAVLMGLGAARHWGAIPRTIGNTVIAVPTAGHRPVQTGGGAVHFVARNLDGLDAVLDATELGPALITTPAQTLFDLLMRPRQGGEQQVAREAARNLQAQVPATDFDEVIHGAARSNRPVREVAELIRSAR